MRIGTPVFAAAVDLPDSDVAAVLVATQMRSPSVVAAYNVLRFASVLVGAGLLLRAGASEQAISAVNHERPHVESAAKVRIASPQPVFAPLAKSHRIGRNGGNGPAAHVSLDEQGQRLAVPKLAFAMSDTATAKARLAADRSNMLAKAGPPRPATPAVVQVAPATRAEAGEVRIATPESVASASPTILSPAHRSSENGLLTPVAVTSRPIVMVMAATSISRPVGAADAASSALAQPMMTPGPRTTGLRSDIHDVMRRPASAWDYADALPGEVTGYESPGQRSAEAQPHIPAQSAPERLAPVAAQPVLARQSAHRNPALAQASQGRVGLAKATRTAEVEAAPVPAKESLSRPLALLRPPPATPSHSRLSTAVGRRAAMLRAHRPDGATLARAAVKAKSAVAPAEARRDNPIADPVVDLFAPAAFVVAASGTDPAATSVGVSGSADLGASTVFADASAVSGAPDDGGKTLRERIPIPAF